MVWEKTKWACGHQGSMQLYGKMSGREARVAYEAGRQCMACWLVEQWEKEDGPRAKMEDRYKLAAAIAENKGKRINVSDSVPVKATNQTAEKEKEMAEKKKSAGKGAKGAAAAAAAKAKAKKKKEEPVTTPETQEAVNSVTKATEEQAAVAEKSQAHKVLDALFATVLDEKDRPDTSQFTEEQIKDELKENAGLIRPEDKAAILTLDEGEMIWDYLCSIHKELAVEKVKGGKKKEGTGDKPKGKKPEKAGEPGKPGVIGSILEFLQEAGKNGIAHEDILKKLSDRFPDRAPEAMGKTIRAQLPTRMAKEKNIKIVKKEDGKFQIAV